MEETEKELKDLLPNQILAQVNKIICKFIKVRFNNELGFGWKWDIEQLGQLSAEC